VDLLGLGTEALDGLGGLGTEALDGLGGLGTEALDALGTEALDGLTGWVAGGGTAHVGPVYPPLQIQVLVLSVF